MNEIIANEYKRMKQEKIKWKHEKDEEKRDKILIKVKEKAAEPVSGPKLYNEELAIEEKQIIVSDMNKCIDGGGPDLEKFIKRQKIIKEHTIKYGKIWEKSHVCKLSNMKKYKPGTLESYKFRREDDLNRNPMNILIFNGKIRDYLNKTSGKSIN